MWKQKYYSQGKDQKETNTIKKNSYLLSKHPAKEPLYILISPNLHDKLGTILIFPLSSRKSKLQEDN